MKPSSHVRFMASRADSNAATTRPLRTGHAPPQPERGGCKTHEGRARHDPIGHPRRQPTIPARRGRGDPSSSGSASTRSCRPGGTAIRRQTTPRGSGRYRREPARPGSQTMEPPRSPIAERQEPPPAPERHASSLATIARQMPRASRRRRARAHPALTTGDTWVPSLNSERRAGPERPIPAHDSRDYNA